MLKNFWFQAHWLIGITAGVVLAVVGFTGGMLSFEGEIQDWLNRDVRTVATQPGAALAPGVLIAAVQSQHPDKRITSVVVSADAHDSARVTFAPPPAPMGAAPAGGRGGARGETRYINPHTGALIDGEANKGQGFFRTTRSIHRWLVAGSFGNQQVGRQIVAVSTIFCMVLALSGLYLRWPRRLGDWRAWLTFDPAMKGRSFLWHLHAVLGTWVLVGFLLMSVTGLSISYDWVRGGLYSLAGVERPVRRGEGPPAATANAGQREGARREGGAARERGAGGSEAAGARESEGRPRREAAPLDLERVWSSFRKETAVAGFSTATLTLPQQPGRPVEIRYLDANPAHNRANNTIAFDVATGAVIRHERYADKRAGEKFVASLFPLHAGTFFGLPGVVLYMIASLSMPVFGVTGWMMYLDRRRKKRAANAARSAVEAAAPLSTPPPGTAVERLLLAFASQAGGARELAWQTAGSLQAAGVAVDVLPLERVNAERLRRTRRALFVVSTFGDGEPPDDARPFLKRLMARSVPLGQMQFGLLALGDRQYKTFCQFGRNLDHWLKDQGAQSLFPPVEVDNGDPQALLQWRERVGTVTGGPALGEWQQPRYETWKLTARTLLNPGSAGGPTFHLELTAPVGSPARWSAGDIVEIQPAQSQQAIEDFLALVRLDGDAVVARGDVSTSLRQALKYCALPVSSVASTPQELVDHLEPLPKREFSIASIPEDGSLHLVVRQTRKPDGALGVGSGWLTQYAALGDEVRARIRENPSFHAPADARPVILIGNGTGIAGLRSLLKARVAAARTDNWLLFGERSAAHDHYYSEEITAWQAQGYLRRFDAVYSRDVQPREYVQHRLLQQAEILGEWLAGGAAIYVCGSAEGMAQGVHAVLLTTLGEAGLEALAEEGRYRRDVY